MWTGVEKPKLPGENKTEYAHKGTGVASGVYERGDHLWTT